MTESRIPKMPPAHVTNIFGGLTIYHEDDNCTEKATYLKKPCGKEVRVEIKPWWKRLFSFYPYEEFEVAEGELEALKK